MKKVVAVLIVDHYKIFIFILLWCFVSYKYKSLNNYALINVFFRATPFVLTVTTLYDTNTRA